MSEENKQVCSQYWKGVPGRGREYPTNQKELDSRACPYFNELLTGSVCEVGCGSGRVASCFAPDRYIGVDINEAAVEAARERFPTHSFHQVSWEGAFPKAGSYLFHTVLLHIPDDELNAFLARCGGNEIVIAETMLRCYRNDKYTYHRDSSEYVTALSVLGYGITEQRLLYLKRSPGIWHIQKYIKREVAE